ncbi:MAG: type III-B CRISPR module RAMP protein Cmr1, partial [Limnochordia bacterium]
MEVGTNTVDAGNQLMKGGGRNNNGCARVMRGIPTCPSKPVTRPHAELVRKELQIKSLTPILGGGTTTSRLDRHSFVRGGTIRGLLRYWWRACRVDTSFKELTNSEQELFGAASQPGRLALSLGDVAATPVARNYRFPDVVRFPFMGKGAADINQESAMISFTLRLDYPQQYEQEIEDALWAWSNFGGIGMRTRRGAGALVVSDYAPDSTGMLTERLKKLCQGASQSSWSILSPRVFYGPVSPDAGSAWDSVTQKLFEFRQYPYGRVAQRGRSRWPEADSIRRITCQSVPRHA